MRMTSIAVVFLSLTSCSDPNLSASTVHIGTTEGIVTSGNVRLITERARPIDGARTLPALCTEPSPDVAIAFARTANLTASLTQPNAPSGSVNATSTSTETVTAMEGRTAGVVALRDGLYAACQAYANGAIGHDAYALILSQYGNLLVALVGGTNPKGGVTAYKPQDAATAALLVACISEFDPTRTTAVSVDGRASHNPLLSSPAVCPTLLANIAKGRASHS